MEQGMLMLLIFLSLTGGAYGETGTYFITAPKTIYRGGIFDISIEILKDNVSVPVEASLQDSVYNSVHDRYDVVTLQTMKGNFIKGVTGTLSFTIDANITCNTCSLRLKGQGPLQFEASTTLQLSYRSVSILIQTDKAIYKPTETVRFRALAVFHDLSLYAGKFNIHILDPSGNKIKILKGLQGSSGVVEGSIVLSDQPQFGTWSIKAFLEDFTDIESQTFKVAEYELPRFEVIVELPPYGLVEDSVLTGKVKANYTFGQPVAGMVELHVGRNVQLRSNECGRSQVQTTQIAFEINGESSFTIPKEDIQRVVGIYDRSEARITAFVTEASTGVKLNGSSVIKFYQNKFSVKFLDSTPNVFKPGLQYTAFVQVSSPDNMPPMEGNNIISAYTLVNYQQKLPDQSLYGTDVFTGSYPLLGQNLTLPANGVLPIDIDIPKNATSITIKVTYGSISDTRTVEKTYSKSENYIQTSLLEKNIKSGNDVTVRVVGTEPLNKLTYQVLSRGSVVATAMLDGKGKRDFTFKLLVTPSMAPTARLVIYYDRSEDEIVVDSLVFSVAGLFENKVSINFNINETKPGESVDVILTADPESQVHILAVDQSVLLLKSGNDITPDKVNDAMSDFDSGSKPKNSEYSLSSSAKSAHDVFHNIGLKTLTDVTLTAPHSYPQPQLDELAYYSPAAQGLQMSPSNEMAMDSQSMKMGLSELDSQSAPLMEVSQVRKVFPEVWLWVTASFGPDGKAILKTTAPDTITSWVASAFSTSLTSGLGVAPSTSVLKVFRPFFVSLTYPRSVTRHEQFVVQATVFNYLPSDLEVKVTLKGQIEFKSIIIYENGTEILVTGNQEAAVTVKSGEQGVAYFPMLSTALGVVDIEVSAQSTVAADGVRRQIIVKPEGAPVSYNSPVFVNIDSKSSQNFEKSVSFTLPPSVVVGSERTRVKATGDLIGLSLSSLTSLITLPTGCGEQSLAKFAPDLYIAQYLNATGQLTDAFKRKIIDVLEAGYQRQLTYRRFDGGFSPFGNYDETGSSWLTALTFRILSEASEFIYVDPLILSKSVMWIIDRQNLEGSFNEFGKVLDKNTQGTGTGPALTAFVLLSLLDAENYVEKKACLKNGGFRCHYYERWGNATEKARTNLENLVASNAIGDQFPLALVSYALSKAKSPASNTALDKLLTFSQSGGGLLHWEANSTTVEPMQSHYFKWRPPRIQARPIDILITSYAILTYTELGRIDEALPAVRWLTTQRNAQGGFSSSQDTVVGLQALSAFAAKSLRPETDLNIVVTAPTPFATFSVTRENALSLQIKELSDASQELSISASGTGFALVDVDYSFNVASEVTTPSFDVSTVLLDDGINSFNLMICTKWLLKKETGMVVQEISIPSGFQPDLSTLGNVAGLKRSDRKGGVVAIYFDKIGSSSLCYSLRMVRESKVAKSQSSYVKTFSYYSPDDQSTVFYLPKALRDSNICDVCVGCCPWLLQ